MAMLYDTFLVLPLIMAVVAMAMAVKGLLFANVTGSMGTALHPALVRVIAVLAVNVFFCWFWVKNGQTLGMQAWRIKLVGMNGQPVTVKMGVKRMAGALLSAICLGMGYWWCLIDKQSRYWHDYLSGSELELLPARKKAAK